MKSSRINVPAWHFLSFYSTSADRIGMKPWRAEMAALSLFCDLLDPMLQVWSTYSCQCVSVNSTCRLVSVNVLASRTPGGLCGSPWISARIKNLTGPLYSVSVLVLAGKSRRSWLRSAILSVHVHAVFRLSVCLHRLLSPTSIFSSWVHHDACLMTLWYF